MFLIFPLEFRNDRVFMQYKNVPTKPMILSNAKKDNDEKYSQESQKTKEFKVVIYHCASISNFKMGFSLIKFF